MKNLIFCLLLLAGFTASAQVPALNDIVKNNTLSPNRVASALEVLEPYTVSGTNTYTVSIGVTGLYSGSATYAAGDVFKLTFPNANTSTTVTININSEGAVAIKDNAGADPAIGSIQAGGTYLIKHNGTNFRIVGGTGSGGAVVWGGITGTLTDQTDLTTAINAKIADAINNGTTTVAPSQNAVFDALALKTDRGTTFRRLTGNHTLDATDLANYSAGQRVMIEMNVGSANTLTVPPNSSVAFPIGSYLEVKQYGGGQTSFVAGSGVTLRATAGILTIANQYAGARLIKVDTDEWYLDNGSPIVFSSTYTPTLNNTTNVNASTAYVIGYFRIGNSVTVFGKVDIDATAAASTATLLGMSLPVTSNLAAEQDLAGTAASNASAAVAPIRIIADATNDRASFVFLALTTNNDSYNFQFSYQVK